jgi:hypothetical protein
MSTQCLMMTRGMREANEDKKSKLWTARPTRKLRKIK